MTALTWSEEPGPVVSRAGDYRIEVDSNREPPFRSSWRPVLGRSYHLGDHGSAQAAKDACELHYARTMRTSAVRA